MKSFEADNMSLYNSRLIDNYIRLLKSRYEYINIHDLLNYAGIEAWQVEDQGHWFTQEQINRFHERLKIITGNKDIAREAGRYAASSDALGAMRHYFLGLVGPARAFEIVNKAASNFTRSAKYQSKKLSRNKFEIIVRPNKGVHEREFQCSNRMGFFEAIALMFYNRLPDIVHPECVFKGGDYCRYLISWKDSRSVRWGRIRTFTTIILVIICVIFSLTHPTLALTTLFPISVSIVLLMSWFVESISKDELNSAIDIHRETSDSLMNQINLNYNNALLINEIGQAITKKHDIDNILANVIQILQKRLDYDRALILLANKEHSRLIFRKGYGYTDEQLQLLKDTAFELDRPESTGPFVVSFREKKPILVSNISNITTTLSPRSLDFAKKMNTKSFISCPIFSENHSLGVITVDNVNNERPLSVSDVNLLMGITNTVGISIYNAMLLEAEINQFKSVIQVLAASIDARDPLTAGHSAKVTEYAVGIAGELGLSKDHCDMLEIAALLHDYGKIGIEDSILKKPGKLLPEEYEQMKSHPEKTKTILERMNFQGVYKRVPEIAGSHHEKINGTGYPRGLKGDQIPLGAKIIAVADFFEAITAKRHYRDPMPLPVAFDLLNRETGKSFDAEIVAALVSYYFKAHPNHTNFDNNNSASKLRELPNCIREYKRTKTNHKCSLEIVDGALSSSKSVNADLVDYSVGGLGLVYSGEEIAPGTKIHIDINGMSIFKKMAMVVWSASFGQSTKLGLKWSYYLHF